MTKGQALIKQLHLFWQLWWFYFVRKNVNSFLWLPWELEDRQPSKFPRGGKKHVAICSKNLASKFQVYVSPSFIEARPKDISETNVVFD